MEATCDDFEFIFVDDGSKDDTFFTPGQSGG